MKLRDWQEKALKLWKKEKRGVVKVVTGGGKTYFAIRCIEEFKKNKKNKPKVLILVPTVTLLDQWIVDLEETYEGNIGKIGGGFNTGSKEDIYVCTYASFKKIANNVDRKNTFLICDECHRAGTKKLGGLLKTGWVASLGLSATPEREFDENFEEIITPILGNKIFEYDYVEAHKDGIISDFELMNIYAPMMNFEDDEYTEISKKIAKRISILGGLNKTDEALKVLFFQRARIVNNARNRIPAALKVIQKHKRNKWLVFCETIDQANKFKRVLDKNNFSSACYHSKITPITRQYNLFLLKNDLIDILITCKSLDEGFNYPDLDSAIILSSSSTSRQRIQRLGRILRTSLNKDKAFIASIYSSDDEFDRLVDEQISFQEVGISIKWSKLRF